MTKFSNAPARAPRGPTMTTGPAVTHEGGQGYEKDAKSALYTLAVTNMVGEATYYESADNRDKRFEDLVHAVTIEDPEFIRGMIGWLRNDANMRSASIVMAAEYVKAGGPNGRQVIAAACSRADEPAEVIGYWRSVHGRNLPAAVKRGVADATVRLYTERAALKWDGGTRGIRMGDVIDIVHPTPQDARQSALFKFLLDQRHGRPDPRGLNSLSTVSAARALDAVPADQRRALLVERGPDLLDGTGYTWERLSGWLPGGMDAAAWEAVIPQMGYMALLRNLRNFEQKGISREAEDYVIAKLEDPDQVARSRQFPYRFFSAWRATGSTTWGRALDRALDLACLNIPEFKGTTLIMVDTSGSMSAPLSAKSQVLRVDAAALFGAAVAIRNKGRVRLAVYATGCAEMDEIPPSVLRTTDALKHSVGQVGMGTETWPSVKSAYRGEDRVIVFTDMQDHPARGYRSYYGSGNGATDATTAGVPATKPVYVWDLAGYQAANVDLSTPNRYLLGGFSDASFRIVPLLEKGRDAGFPWEG